MKQNKILSLDQYFFFQIVFPHFKELITRKYPKQICILITWRIRKMRNTIQDERAAQFDYKAKWFIKQLTHS